MATTCIHSLPAELTVLVSENLLSGDYLNFRQTCKGICEKTARFFLKRYFRTRYIMLERRSLINLVFLSEHPEFGPAIQTLEVCMDHLTRRDHASDLEVSSSSEDELSSHDEASSHGEASSEEGPSSGEGPSSDEKSLSGGTDRRTELPLCTDETVILKIWRPYRQKLKEQDDIFGQGLRLLTRAMSNLSNCRKIIIDDTHQPWGASTLARELGVTPTRIVAPDRRDSIFFARTLIRYTLIAAASSHLPLENFGICFGSTPHGTDDDKSCASACLLDLNGLNAPLLKSCLTKVTHLTLQLTPEALEAEKSWVARFINFVGLFESLSHFEVHFENRDELRRFTHICEVLEIPNLQSFSLGYIDLTEPDLIKLLLRHKKTLRSLDLTSISVVDGTGTWTSVIRTIRDALHVDKFEMHRCGYGIMDYDDGTIFDYDLSQSSFFARNWEEYTVIINEQKRLEGQTVIQSPVLSDSDDSGDPDDPD